MRERPRQRAKFSYFRGPLLLLFNTTRRTAGRPQAREPLSHGRRGRSVQHNARARSHNLSKPSPRHDRASGVVTRALSRRARARARI